jgi:hypothetical protein
MDGLAILFLSIINLTSEKGRSYNFPFSAIKRKSA